MAKLVQEGLYLAQGEEGWLLGCWLGEVHHHAYVWTNVNALMVNPLSLEFCHPGTALLALAREEVGIEYGEIAAVLVEYLVCLHVWMVYRNILVFLEGDAVELVGKTEYAVYHLVELEVWAEHLCIQVILLHLQLVRIVSEIPWLHLEVIAFQFLGKCLHLFSLFDGCWLVGIDEVVQQFIHILRFACHAVAEHVVGVGLEAQELSQFTAQIHQLLAYFQVVLLVVVGADCVTGHVHLFAQFALGRVGHEWRIARIVECENPAFLILFLGCMFSCSDGCFWQTFELRLVCDVKGERLVLLQQVLRELEGEHACILGELAQFLLAFLVEEGTAAYESVVAGFEQHLLFCIQFTVRMVVNKLDALEELLVQCDVVGMLGEDRAHLLCQFLHLVAGLGTHHAREYVRHSAQEVVIVFTLFCINTGDGVFERWLCRVVYNLVGCLVVAADTFHESLLIVAELNAVEWGCIVWGAVWQEERILSLLNFFLVYGCILHFITLNLLLSTFNF